MPNHHHRLNFSGSPRWVPPSPYLFTLYTYSFSRIMQFIQIKQNNNKDDLQLFNMDFEMGSKTTASNICRHMNFVSYYRIIINDWRYVLASNLTSLIFKFNWIQINEVIQILVLITHVMLVFNFFINIPTCITNFIILNEMH